MFDTMTMTKVVGALCGSLLVFMMTAWAGASLFYMGGSGHGHGEVAQAYVIETGAEEAPAETAEDFGALLAAADAAAGEKVFAKCKACHKLDDTNGTGPHLNGVVDRAKGSVAGFGYSEAMLAHASEAWTPENLNGFLENPKGNLPGTNVAFAGLHKVVDRANVIAYLATLP
jgi:cytochrome c